MHTYQLSSVPSSQPEIQQKLQCSYMLCEPCPSLTSLCKVTWTLKIYSNSTLRSYITIHFLNTQTKVASFFCYDKGKQGAKKEQTVAMGKVASHKSSTVFSPNKRAVTEVILVQRSFYRTLHLKLEWIRCYHDHSSSWSFSLQVNVAFLPKVNKWRQQVPKSPVLSSKTCSPPLAAEPGHLRLGFLFMQSSEEKRNREMRKLLLCLSNKTFSN